MVPSNEGVKTVATSTCCSVGVGHDHTIKRMIENMMSSGDRGLMILTQVMEDNSSSLAKVKLNTNLEILLNRGEEPGIKSPPKLYKRFQCKTTYEKENNGVLKQPVVTSGMSSNEIKSRKGCFSELVILFYMMVVCNGNWNALTKTMLPLTWYEEWLLYFEMLWGRMSGTWRNL